MLYAAEHPSRIEKLALVGMGPVNDEMKERYEANIASRLSRDEREEMSELRRS